MPAGIAVGVVATATFNLVKPFPDLLPVRVMLADAGGVRGRAGRSEINAVYQYRPTIAATPGLSVAKEVLFAEVARPARVLNAPADLPLAQVYPPPAYLVDPRPRLPVSVLVAGQAGWPTDC